MNLNINSAVQEFFYTWKWKQLRKDWTKSEYKYVKNYNKNRKIDKDSEQAFLYKKIPDH